MAVTEALDPSTASPEDLTAWCVVTSEVDKELRPGEPTRPLASHLARIRAVEQAWVERHWVARDDDKSIVGWCTASWRDAPENPDVVFLDAAVLPSRRKRGLATALLREAICHAAANRRTLVTVETKSGSAGAAFLAARGAAQKTVDRRSLLDLRTVDVPALTTWGAPSPAAAGRYSLVQWRNETPDALLEDHAALRTAMNDAPRERLELEDEIYTSPMIRAFESTWASRGDEVWVTCVRDQMSGQLVALTDINAPAYWPEWAYQEDTVVLGEHRGHGLGRWIKTANLARVMADRPTTEWVQTFNAEVNRHMLDINEAMGFRKADAWGEWQVSLADLERSLRA